jgi:hypothetical protein
MSMNRVRIRTKLDEILHTGAIPHGRKDLAFPRDLLKRATFVRREFKCTGFSGKGNCDHIYLAFEQISQLAMQTR